MPTDQDAYLVARSCLTMSPKPLQLEPPETLLPLNTITATTASTNNQNTTQLHAHNPAYSPTSEEGPPILLPIPPPLQYSTLENGPDEEEDATATPEENQVGLSFSF